MRRWAVVLGVALALRALVAFGLLGSMPQVHDAASYGEVAERFLTDFPGSEPYYWPPGNSLSLAALFAVLGPGGIGVRLLMLLFSMGGVVFTTLLARQVDPDLWHATDSTSRKGLPSDLITGLLGALYMPAVMLVAQGYSQHLAALALVALAYFTVRGARERSPWLVAMAGIAFGIGSLTRPSMVSVAPVLLFLWGRELWIAGRARAPRLLVGAALFAVLAGALVGPVVLHNRATGGGTTISTNNERNFFLGNNAYTPSYKTSHLGQRDLADLEPEVQDYLRGFYERPDARDAMQAEALSYIAHHPLETGVRTFNRATSFWGFDYLASNVIAEDRDLGKKGRMLVLAPEAGTYVLVMLLAIVALVGMKDDSDRFARRTLVALALAYELPYMIAFSGGTYHFPVIPLLLPFAGIALARGSRDGIRRVIARVARSWKVWAAVAVFAAIQVQYAYYAILMKG